MKNMIWIVNFLLIIANMIYSNSKLNINGGFGGVLLGFEYHDMNDINQFLTTHNIKHLKDFNFGIGGGGGGFVNNIYFGGWGFSSFNDIVDNNSIVVNVNYSKGFSQFGYLFYLNDYFMIIPAIGYGGYSITMNVSYAGTTNLQFNNILQNPGNTSILQYSPSAYNFNLLLLFPINILMFGLNIGYIYTPKSSWNLNVNSGYNYIVLAGPKINEHAIYVNLGIYFGSYSKNMEKNFNFDYNNNQIQNNKTENDPYEQNLKEKADKILENLKNSDK